MNRKWKFEKKSDGREELLVLLGDSWIGYGWYWSRENAMQTLRNLGLLR